MFEAIFENAKRRAKEYEREEEVVNAIADMIMNSPTQPESVRLSFALGAASKNLTGAVYDLARLCTIRNQKRYSAADIEKLKQTIKYINIVEAGIREYAKALSFDAPKTDKGL